VVAVALVLWPKEQCGEDVKPEWRRERDVQAEGGYGHSDARAGAQAAAAHTAPCPLTAVLSMSLQYTVEVGLNLYSMMERPAQRAGSCFSQALALKAHACPHGQ